MKRRDFLGKLLKIGTGVAATAVAIPVMGKNHAEKQETFTIDDAFIQLHGNSNLYYIKQDSLLNRELMKAIGDHYLPREKFGCYLPVSHQYVPFKDTYTIEDFRQLIMLLEDCRQGFRYFCDGQYREENVGLMRLFKDEKHGYYKIDLFEAYKNGMYGSK